MKQHQQRYGVAKMAKVLGVSRSGYYAWKGRNEGKREKDNHVLANEIRRIFNKHKGRYGSPRVWEELKGLGWRVSRKRVERLMREQGLKARRRRKWVRTTDSRHSLSVAENLLNREFYADGPGQKWVSDITYLPAGGGWLYLTVIIDLFDRKAIGWAMSGSLAAECVCQAFKMACQNRPPRERLLFHSDRGVQYCSEEFRRALAKGCPTVRQSMSRKGNCWDNACAESFFKTLKEEMGIMGRGYNRKQVRAAVFEYIEISYDRYRRHSALGYATPVALTNSFAA
jgi:transposase InsO family protein